MSLNDYLKCPGPDRSRAEAVPAFYTCVNCSCQVEIWSDEHKRKCPQCGSTVSKYVQLVYDKNLYNEKAMQEHPSLYDLIQTAMQLGASDAAVILSAEIIVKNELANLCNGDPPCENYSLSVSCPPHVSGPAGFQELKKQSQYSVVIRLDVPSSAIFSSERREIMQLLHQIVSGVEQAAVAMGYKDSKGFAGGSCKKIFCYDHPDCNRLSKNATCRNPKNAKPSMSGFGIDVAKLITTAGWNLKNVKGEDAADPDSMTWIAGLVVIKKHKG